MAQMINLQRGQKTEANLGIVGGTKFSRYPKMTVESTYNMVVSGQDVDQASLVNFLGYEIAIKQQLGEARALFVSTIDNAMYGVFGNELVKISPQLTSRTVAFLNSTTGSVFISENQNGELGIVDGENLYVYNYNNFTFNIPDLDFRPLYITYQDTYLIATGDDLNWHLSGSNDALTWDPLLRTTMQTQADTIVAAVRLDRQLWVIGEKVAEKWTDQGRAGFPYARDNAIAIDYGCVSRNTIAEGFGMLVWLSQNDNSSPKIIATNGGQPQSISVDGLDFKLSRIKNPESVYGFLFEEDGHVYYQLVFVKDNFSFIYDFNLKMFFNVTDDCLNHHIAQDVKLFNNNLYFISTKDSNIYETSTDITTYAGKIIPRIRICPTIRLANDDTFTVKAIKMQLEQGIDNPPIRVDLSISKDGGYNFANIEGRELNALGNRQSQLRFYRLGMSNDFTTQFRFWSSGRFVIKNAVIEITR